MNCYEKIYSVLKNDIDNGCTSGANLLVIQNGEEKLYCEYGYRDIENNTPMSRDTIFRLYSQTKPITAAACILLASRGKIDLAADIADYLPEFKEPYVNANNRRVPAARHITIRDLLNMTSGLAYPDENTAGGRQSEMLFKEMDNRLYTDNPMTTAEFSRLAGKLDLCFEPGSKFMYGISADIVGALVEKVSGMRFSEFLKKNFFEPLEMHDTDFHVPAEKSHRLAKVYDYSDNGLWELKTDHLGLHYMRDIPPAFESGGAGLCSTLDDYSHFGTMLLNNGTYKGREILSPSAVRFLTHGGLKPELMHQLNEGWDWMSGYTYGNFMRVCENESMTSVFSCKGEYGWDGWLGTFFSNEPMHGITLLMGVQQAGIGQTGGLVRKLKNIVMSELVK